jgi:dihydroorotate dehydrogenase
MKNIWFKIKFGIVRILYKYFLKEIFFLRDPEIVHDKMVKLGNFLGKHWIFRFKTRFWFFYENKALGQNIAGINFKNPIGLAAGFDKDGYLTQILPEVGFGFEEIGSITGEPCEGNPRPWLWRLPKSKSLAVHYGLKNEGCEKIVSRIKNQESRIPLGISIAKTNSLETTEEIRGIADYKKAYQAFVKAGIGDYFTINISCPNAFGGEPFTEVGKLEKLLSELYGQGWVKPVFIKLPADLSHEEILELTEVGKRYKITGFVCSNLTKKRDWEKIKEKDVPEKGGLSGKLVEEASNELISFLYNTYKKEFVLIGCGGVFSAEDAYKKIKLGASLIQLITGMIFEGPQLIGEINYGLAKLLKKDGYKNISEAVGKDID